MYESKLILDRKGTTVLTDPADTAVLSNKIIVHSNQQSTIDSIGWTSITGKPATFTPSTHRHSWSELDGIPTTFTPAAHTHMISNIANLAGTLDSKANLSDVLTDANVKNIIAAMFQNGTHTNATVVVDVANNSISVSSSGGSSTGPTQEETEDLVAGLVTQGAGINVLYDDVNNILSISLSGISFTSDLKDKLDGIAAGATKNSTDNDLRDRSTHTGVQDMVTVDGLVNALNGKMNTTNFKTINGASITGTGDIVTAVSFSTDASAQSYSTNNPGVIVFSTETS